MSYALDLTKCLAEPDDQLFRSAAAAIDYAIWRVANQSGQEVCMRSLPVAQQVVARLAGFHGLFGNGGLGAWLEYDGDAHGPELVQALVDVGLPRSANALSQVYSLFERHDAWHVHDERMQLVEARRAELAVFEQEVWSEYDGFEQAAGRFVRAHREALQRATS